MKIPKLNLIVGWLLILIVITLNPWTIIFITKTGIIKSLSVKIIIWFFDIACLSLGFILIKKPYLIRNYIKEIALAIFSIILAFVLLDIGLRLFHNTRGETVYSEYFGWENVPYLDSKRLVEGYGEVKISTTKYGFRVFGNPQTDKTKIFVIGDSYTGAYNVSDGETYYEYLKKDPNIEIFALGVGGYGTIQEFLALDKYFDIIKPDIVLWQFCSNDLINNDYDLESQSYINDHMVRPYYKDGKIVRLYPRRKYDIFNIARYSYILKFIDIKISVILDGLFGSLENKLVSDPALLKNSLRTTSEVMALVRERAHGIPVIAFEVDKPEWVDDYYLTICKNQNIFYIQGIPEAIQESKKAGVKVDGLPYDDHWNNNASAIAGKMILEYLKTHHFVK